MSLTRPLCILIKGTHFLRGNPEGTHAELKGNPVIRIILLNIDYWESRESRITCMRMLRTLPFPPKSGEKPYLWLPSRFGLWRDFLNREVKFDVTWSYVKPQTAKMKLLPSVSSSLNSRVQIFVFMGNSRRQFSIFMWFNEGLKEKNTNSEVIFAVCRLTLDHVTSNFRLFTVPYFSVSP